jgi:hypothetical protein
VLANTLRNRAGSGSSIFALRVVRFDFPGPFFFGERHASDRLVSASCDANVRGMEVAIE